MSMSISGLTTHILYPNPNAKPLPPLTVSNHNKFANFNARFRVSARVQEDYEVKLTNSDSNVGTFDQFSAPVMPSSSPSVAAKQRKDDEERQNYYVNMGYAIRCLREDLPELFYRELSFDIYRDDIIFKDPLNTFVGIENYKSIFWGLRFHGNLFFRALWVDIVSVWQPVASVIMVRWTVHGIPRVPWESRGRFDGTSEYKLDKNGKIYEHKVDNIAINSPPKFRVLAVEELIQSLGCPTTPKPTCFEFSSYSMMDFVPLMVKFRSISHYMDSVLGLPQSREEEDCQKSGHSH